MAELMAMVVNRGRGAAAPAVSAEDMMPVWAGARPRLPSAADLQAKLCAMAAVQNAVAAAPRGPGGKPGGCVLAAG